MKKLFSLIALVAVALTACEPQQSGNTPGEVDASLKIKLTSSSVMNFEAVGGEGVITYEFEKLDATRANVAEAATAVAWIENLTSTEEGKVTFSVAANEGKEERSATIKVSYGEHSFMVMVKQAGSKTADVNFTAVRGTDGIKEASFDVAGMEVKVAVVSGLANAKKVLSDVREGKASYHFIEVMGCPGGCVNGGGQPTQPAVVRNFVDLKALRASALYASDEANAIRKSHENPTIKKLYAEYLGEPNGHKAHELLHTTYSPKSKY